MHSAIADDAPPDERDVLVEVAAVGGALERLGYVVEPLALTLDLDDARRRLTALQPQFVFNLVEAVAGHDRLLPLGPMLLEAVGVPYTGAPVSGLTLSSNKLVAKRWLRANEIPTPDWLERGAPTHGAGKWSWIVKSVWDHASIGLDDASVVAGSALSDCFGEHGPGWFAEQYVDGREFNVALLAGDRGVEVLPVAEMTFVDFPAGKPRIVGYTAKWDPQSFEYHHTVRRFGVTRGDAALRDTLCDLALRCWMLFDMRGYARVDFRVDRKGRPWVLEVNANPCLAPDAGFAAALAEAGIPYDTAVARIAGDCDSPTDAAVEPACTRLSDI